MSLRKVQRKRHGSSDYLVTEKSEMDQNKRKQE